MDKVYEQFISEGGGAQRTVLKEERAKLKAESAAAAPRYNYLLFTLPSRKTDARSAPSSKRRAPRPGTNIDFLPMLGIRIKVLLGSGSGTGSAWIYFGLAPWIRIRIEVKSSIRRFKDWVDLWMVCISTGTYSIQCCGSGSGSVGPVFFCASRIRNRIR